MHGLSAAKMKRTGATEISHILSNYDANPDPNRHSRGLTDPPRRKFIK